MESKIELLHYYEEQWKYRNTHYWKLVNKDIYIGIIVIIFPYLCEYLGVIASASLSPLFFSITGVIISALFSYLLLCENSRIVAVRSMINKLIREIGHNNYSPPRVHKIFRVPLAYVIPFFILLFHLLLAILY